MSIQHIKTQDMEKIMDKVLSIFSLLSVIWSNILLNEIMRIKYFHGGPGTIEGNRLLVAMYLLYFIVLLYNIFSISYCQKVLKKQQTSIIPSVISIVGTILYLIVAIFFSFAISLVQLTGGV